MITIEDLNRFRNQYSSDNAMNLYQDIAGKSAIYPGAGAFSGLAYCALKLNGEAGEFAEQVGKAWRDDDGRLTAERRAKLKRELGDVLWYVARAAAELEYFLSDIAAENLRKLHDRAERGTLQGSGDER